jgi:hypothetical protein
MPMPAIRWSRRAGGDEGDLEGAGSFGEGCERDDLVARVPVDSGTAGDVFEQLVGDAGADVLGAAVRRPGAIRAETGAAGELREKGERGTWLGGRAVAYLGDVDGPGDVSAVENRSGCGGHPFRDATVLQVRCR